MEQNRSTLVDISEITRCYLPVSRKKARKFIWLYMEPKRIGNRLYVNRTELEHLLADPDRENFPLNI